MDIYNYSVKNLDGKTTTSLNAFRDKISKSEPLPVKGSEELQNLAESYNEMYEENRRTSEHLKHVAEHDALTRLYNRWAFESFREQFTEDVALLLLDVDGFKGFNDVYGHDVGDRVLQKVAKLMKHCFRFWKAMSRRISTATEQMISARLCESRKNSVWIL